MFTVFIHEFLQEAIQKLVMVNDGIGEENLKDGDEPMIEATIEGEGAFVLILYVPVMGMHVEFTFTFLPVARESLDTDLLEKQLRDAEEEIDKLKNELAELRGKRNDLIVLVPTGCNPDNTLVWNAIIHNSPSVYELSVDRRSIKILQAGLYQIARPCCLKVNGVNVARGNGGVYFHLQLNDVLTLEGSGGLMKSAIRNENHGHSMSILKLIF
jgi:hypothetical protein